MELNKYIPGDLVMTNGVPLGTAKDVVYRVVSSYPSKTLKLKDRTVLKGDCCAWVKDIVPIPITTKILEKNGWKKDGKWHHLKTRRAYLYTIQDAGQPDEFLICAYTDKHNLTSVSSVHQLQNLLFGLGLNSEMEV